jgi:hypothetical protein
MRNRNGNEKHLLLNPKKGSTVDSKQLLLPARFILSELGGLCPPLDAWLCHLATPNHFAKFLSIETMGFFFGGGSGVG